MFTVVLTGFTFNVFSHPCHFQQRVALSSGVAACWWAATSQEKERLHVSRVVWGCALFSVMSFFISSLTANNTISSIVKEFFVFFKPPPPNIRTCTNLSKWILFHNYIQQIMVGCNRVSISKLEDPPRLCWALVSKASDKRLPWRYRLHALFYVGWALIYGKCHVCSVYSASTVLQFHTKSWQFEPRRLCSAQGWKRSRY